MALPQPPATDKPKFRELLESYRGELVSAVPPKMAEHLAPDRIIRLALTEFRRTPKLANCHPQSVCAAIITALRPEPQTLLRANAPTLAGRPA